MRIFKHIAILLILPVSWAVAQENEADKAFLERWLQDKLSVAGREISITGFRGALSSEATLQTLTIADDEGIWLTLSDATLNWSRAALLRGRLEVNALRAGNLEIKRRPATEKPPSPEDAQATEFALPDLPVSVAIEAFDIANIALSRDVLGQDANLSISGRAMLADGSLETAIELNHKDRPDKIALGLSFANATKQLSLDLDVNEAPGGLISDLLGVPGKPSLRLEAKGNAPLNEFVAEVALSSDGTERLAGSVEIDGIGSDAQQTYAFSANLGGDLRPLVSSDVAPFFGEETSLRVAGRTRVEAGLLLERLSIRSRVLALEADLALDADGFPQRFDLDAEITLQEPIPLPVSGPTVKQISGANVEAAFDAQRGEAWTADITLEGFDDTTLRIGQAGINAEGTLSKSDGQAVTAFLKFNAENIQHSDPALAEAIGRSVAGLARVNWRQGNALRIESFNITSGDAQLQANGLIDGLSDGFPVQGRAVLTTANLARFASLADLDLAGAARAELSGSAALLGGAFDISLDARTNGLQIGQPRIDPLLSGESTLALAARRSVDGTFIDRLEIDNQQLSANLSGRLNADMGQLATDARLSDVGLVERTLSGPASLTATAEWQAGSELRLTQFTTQAAGATLSGTLALLPEAEDVPFEGRLSLASPDLSMLSAFTGRDLEGGVNLVLSGDGVFSGTIFDLTLEGQSTDLKIGEQMLDPLLEGDGRLQISASGVGSAYQIDDLSLRFPKLSADGQASLDAETAQAMLVASVTELSGLAPRFSGPARFDTAFEWTRGGRLNIERLQATALDTEISANGWLVPEDQDLPFDGRLSVTAKDLSRFAGVLGRSLAGEIALNAEGQGAIKAPMFSGNIDLKGESFRSGIPDVDKLVAGDLTLQAAGAYGDGPPNIERVALDASGLEVDISDQPSGDGITTLVRLRDLGQFAPGFDGPATLEGNLRFLDQDGRDANVDLNVSGPSNIRANIKGTIRKLAETVSLDVTGQAPLAVANRFITPNSVLGQARFDLRVEGAPSLAAVSGRADLAEGRLAVPTANLVLNAINGSVGLANSNAQVNVSGLAEAGGQVTVEGPIGLTPPHPADLTVLLRQLAVADGELYATTANGTVSVQGPLTGGATIGGRIDLGTTELRVPSGGAGAGQIIDVTHLGEPAQVRESRRRAGLLKDSDSGGGASFPIDLTISAPARVFVRGRGLDAELGGELRLFGTTRDVAASGTFELIRGRLDLLGKRLVLTEGLIDLRGALDPYLRVVAETTADDITVRVILEGLASDPTVSFESSPDLPQDEIAARLLFGRGIDQISPFQAAQLIRAAATLSGRGSGGLVGTFRNQLGLSDFDVTSTASGATQFTAGAYLSDNLYSEIVVDTEGNEEINLNLDLSPQLTIRGSAGSDNSSGIGIFFEKDY